MRGRLRKAARRMETFVPRSISPRSLQPGLQILLLDSMLRLVRVRMSDALRTADGPYARKYSSGVPSWYPDIVAGQCVEGFSTALRRNSPAGDSLCTLCSISNQAS